MEKKEKTLEQLRADLLATERKRNRIRNRIDEVEFKEIFPTHVAKYEGKFFKYQNAFNSEDKWFIYIFVKKVTYQRWYKGFKAEGFAFQHDTNGEISFQVKDIERLLDSCTEITKAVFTKALSKVQIKIDTLINIL